MSLSFAVDEMLLHLDSILGSVSSPTGNINRLPDDVVVLRSLEKQRSGIGRISEEDSIAYSLIEQGQFHAVVDSILWSNDNQNVVNRARELYAHLLTINNTATPHGLFKRLLIKDTNGPEYYEHAKWWKISIATHLTYEYRFEEVPGTGIIQEISVDFEGELDEEFTVS